MERDEALNQLKFHLGRAQDHMRQYANTHRKSSIIKPGDWVYLKIRPPRQVSMTTKLHPKLLARYYGPYLVLRQIGAVAFQLQPPEQSQIHPVFHVSQLKLAVGNQPVDTEIPTELQEDSTTYQPHNILETRTLNKFGEQVQQFLIQWQGKSPEEATWENNTTIQHQFPDFNLEGRVASMEGGIDRQESQPQPEPRALQMYYRRKKAH
uniref:Chromo domain-containing protein n=1 Tax=Cajanus cajan TaxID=3821 RepID=A0A151R888_CAJCA|nr:hypothetical protein KK1_040019 [Cajanus cajan]